MRGPNDSPAARNTTEYSRQKGGADGTSRSAIFLQYFFYNIFMPVFIYQDDAIDKIDRVEGLGWKEHDDRASDYTFQANKTAWETFDAEIKKESAEDQEYSRDIYSHPTIYGKSGWNRYYVTGYGEIVFSRYNSSDDGLQKAKQEGFRIG